MKRGLVLALARLGLVLVLAAAWRAWPRPPRGTPTLPAARALVLDASASATRTRPGWSLWARGELERAAREALTAGEELYVVVFGREVRRVRGGPQPAAWLERLVGRGGEPLRLGLGGREELGSELDRALASLEADLLRAGRRARTLRLAVDGGFSGPDPSPRLARWERAGVVVERVALPSMARADAALLDVRLPEDPAVGSPLVASVELGLASAGAGAARLELELALETAGGEVRERALELAPPGEPAGPGGYRRARYTAQLGATPEGLSRLSARVRLLEAGSRARADACPENDVGGCSVRAGAARVVGLCREASDAEAARLAFDLGGAAWPGVQWVELEPRELLSVSARLDALVSFDLASEELSASLVRELLRRGGGWLACGGWPLLASLSPELSPDARELSGLLPLARAPLDRPPRDVVLLVDGSGSMRGEPFEHVRRALGELLRVAPEEDSLRLRFFTSTLGAAVDLDTRPEVRAETRARLAALDVPGGATDILYSLEQLLPAREGRERGALVILLSDGRDSSAFDLGRRARELHAELAAHDSELRAIAMGADADLAYLDYLVGEGEEAVPAGDLTRLAELFQREVFREELREGELEARVEVGDPTGFGGELCEAWRAAGVELPRVRRYLRTRTREGARVLWRSRVEDEALLAAQRAGGGRVAAWTSVPRPGWSPAYAGRLDLLGPLVRWLAGGARRALSPRLTASGRELRLEGVPEDWPVELEGTLRWGAGPEGLPLEAPPLRFDLAPSRAGRDPRGERCAAWPVELEELAPGAPLVVELRPLGGGEVLALCGMTLPPPAELGPGGPRLAPGPWDATGQRAEVRPVQRVDPWARALGLAGGALLAAAAVLGRGR